ncbi:RNA polymerase sigma factor [Bordetella genomosp. 9]|uniref:RNA polymerase subunit sigma n=1 Tax=Bordetella genomosp. 9 TaxID=1416803 RepID=A0A1W6YX52_9BORD|nr:RNA polymerase sigma factor [Bordetella genomosp. 9]ARP85667.1 RNA polymerase subunit sigma [Bordetella genomosp. 9]ARP89640.1 RNA polymerase subunit sigma [Bordetella genomosp. 9]
MQHLHDHSHGESTALPVAYEVSKHGATACTPIATSTHSYEAVFRELVQNHATRLHRFIIKHIGNCPDAEDLAQQAFLEAAKSYHSFRGESQLSTWLYGIALNLVRNYLSRAPECRYYFVSEDALHDHASQELAPDGVAEQNQTLRLLEESIAELPENMRSILLMMGLNDMTYEEAAARLTVPVGTIRSRLSRARAALRHKLQSKGLYLDA